jgi:radical SAM/Cys-rich protein
MKVVVVAATAAGLGAAVLRIIWTWLSLSKFEYSSINLASMTRKELKEAAEALHGISKKGAKGAKGKPQEQLTSLIPEVLQDLEEAGGTTAPDALIPTEELDFRAKALAAVGAPPFKRFLKDRGCGELKRGRCEVFQINVGLYCNQACTHCHVESSPLRKEMVSEDVVDRCLFLLRASKNVKVLDLTGGAPEMNSGFHRLVEGAAHIRDTERPELRIIDRCNLTVLLEPGQEELAEFLRRNGVEIVASLPSYDADQTDRQRGRKVFERSIEGLRRLNAQGYGTELSMDLIFNPPGAFLPPRQEMLEAKYRDEMEKKHNIVFSSLITLANMPVKRFFDFLRKQGTLEGYMDLLVRNFNPGTVPHLMCINTLSVRWDGRLYDCDFNQQLDMTLGREPLTVFNVDSLDDERLQNSAIRTSAHCFGCTASQGSS